MADEDINKAENFMNSLNSLNLTQTNQIEDIDQVLSTLLTSSISAPPAEDLNDLDDISNEYTELNNTIDALNSYLDVWEERHENLRAKIREALADGEDDMNVSSCPDQPTGATGSASRTKPHENQAEQMEEISTQTALEESSSSSRESS